MEKKVALITGASSGIGQSLSFELSEKGFYLILCGRNIESLNITKNKCAFPEKIKTLLYDAALPNQLDGFVTEALSCFHQIDVLINNAGVSQRGLIDETQPEVFRNILEIDFFAPILLTKKLLPHLQSRPWSRIVVINSMSGLFGFPQRAGYAAAKHALKGFFETLQLENKNKNLAITIAYPGRINTPISLSAIKGDGSKHNIMDAGQANGIPVTLCAKRIIKGMIVGKKTVIVAKGERILLFLHKFLPSLFFKIATIIKPN